jgi:hypothetical protein
LLVSVSTKMIRASVVLVAGVAPHVEVAVRPVRVAAAGLEPGVLVARVVDGEVGDDPDAPGVRLRDELGEVRQRAELGQDGDVVADVVARRRAGRRVERRDPEAVDAEPLDVVELGDQAVEVARPEPFESANARTRTS